MPAFKRYTSNRIDQVKMKADLEGLKFYILSGKHGLVEQNQSIDYYYHELLDDDVNELIQLVSNQLSEIGVTRVDYFTLPIDNNEAIAPYKKTIVGACKNNKITCGCRPLEENRETINWKYVLEKAADAGLVFLRNRVLGEQLFNNLLERHPDDGMVYFERAVTRRRIGELELAKIDYEKARNKLPLKYWQEQAGDAIKQITIEQSEGGTVDEARRRINLLDNIAWKDKRHVIQILDKVISEPKVVLTEGRVFVEQLVKAIFREHNIKYPGVTSEAIKQLYDSKIVGDFIKTHMNTVRIFGNKRLHEDDVPLAIDAYVSITALVAIVEWRNRGKSDSMG